MSVGRPTWEDKGKTVDVVETVGSNMQEHCGLTPLWEYSFSKIIFSLHLFYRRLFYSDTFLSSRHRTFLLQSCVFWLLPFDMADFVEAQRFHHQQTRLALQQRFVPYLRIWNTCYIRAQRRVYLREVSVLQPQLSDRKISQVPRTRPPSSTRHIDPNTQLQQNQLPQLQHLHSLASTPAFFSNIPDSWLINNAKIEKRAQLISPNNLFAQPLCCSSGCNEIATMINFPCKHVVYCKSCSQERRSLCGVCFGGVDSEITDLISERHEPPVRECTICRDTMLSTNMVRVSTTCHHEFCRVCLARLALNTKNTQTARCPAQRCASLLDQRCVETLCEAGLVHSHLVDRWATMLRPNDQTLFCPWPRCSALLAKVPQSRRTHTCPVCSQHICSMCEGKANGDDGTCTFCKS